MNLISTVCPLSKRLKKPEKGRLITMEVLDRVYSAFSNLDRDFARSKKSRTDFILEKFGGDIDMGSMIILDAISASTVEETAEDIQKLTFVKEIFEKLKDARDNLDSLPDFKFTNGSLFQDLILTLKESQATGTGVRNLVQGRLRKVHKDAYHFVATADGLTSAPFAGCRVLYAFNENMLGLISATSQGPDFKTFGLYEKKNAIHAVEITPEQATKALK